MMTERQGKIVLLAPLVLGAVVVICAVVYLSSDSHRKAASQNPKQPHSELKSTANPPWTKGPSEISLQESEQKSKSDWRLSRHSPLNTLLDEHLAAFQHDMARAKELLDLMRGTSIFFKRKEVLEKCPGCEPEVRLQVARLIEESVPSDPQAANILLTGISELIDRMIRSNELRTKLGHSLASAFGAVVVKLEDYKLLDELIRRHMDNAQVVRLVNSLPRSAAASREYTELMWKIFKESKDSKVRNAALGQLEAQMRDNEDLRKDLLSLFPNQSEEGRVAIANGLRGAGFREDAYEFAKKNLQSEASDVVRATFVEVLSERRDAMDPEVLKFVRAWLGSNYSVLRMACVSYLGQKGEPEDVARIEAIAKFDPEEEVRRTAESALEKLRERQ